MKHFFLALRFLTILPLGGMQGEVPEKDLVASIHYYPPVGAFIGLLLYWLFRWTLPIWPPFLAAALTVTAWVILTAGIHLDGLMDTFDGFGIRGDREKRLAVMKDSRVGAFGVQAAVLLVILKAAAVASLAVSPRLLPALIVAPAAGRTAMAAMMGTSTYARTDHGLGKLFVEGAGFRHLAVSLVLFLVIAGITPGTHVLALAASQALLFLLLRRFFHGSFGGVTGDLLGAACEIHELSVLLLATLVF